MIALCILGTNESSRHPLNDIIIKNNFRSIFKRIYEFKNIRDAISHGKDHSKNKEWVKENFDYFKKVIKTVFPKALEYKIEYMNQNNSQIDNERTKAKANLIEYFGGNIIYGKIPKEMSDLLEKIFIFKENLTEDNFVQYIKDLSSCLQTAIFLLYGKNLKNIKTSCEIKKDECLKKTVDFNFIQSEDLIPETLKKVNQNRFEKSLNGKDETLLANLLALFASLENEELENLSKKVPYLVKTANEIAELRGHGNETITLSDKNKEIAKKTLETIKLLLEVEL
jgi:hypothetical protein